MRLDSDHWNDRLSIIMKSATVADLRNSFATVSKWIHEGESVVITKRGLPFATLSPMKRRKILPPLDRLARLQKLFPDGPVGGDARDVLDYDRGDR
jgi:antitoxin (DNA-binding transcriptional repressor) of toxin-antitoxin stability system